MILWNISLCPSGEHFGGNFLSTTTGNFLPLEGDLVFAMKKNPTGIENCSNVVLLLQWGDAGGERELKALSDKATLQLRAVPHPPLYILLFLWETEAGRLAQTARKHS